jgi:L-idonate 5-dehydrogenase
MLSRPDVLVLDEPTNHLDTDSIGWLEQQLAAYEGAILFVSHDRDFIDAVAERVIEVAGGTATEYVGGFAEFILVRPDQVRPLPDSLPLPRAVLAEPLAVALHALGRAGGVNGARVLVGGSGPIGLLVAGAAKATGAAEVWTTDLLSHPLSIAGQLGVDRTVRIGDEPLPDQYFDVAIEASGASGAVGATLAAVRRRGVMVQLGMFPPGPRPTELSAMVAKEIDYRGAFRFDTEFDDAIALLAASAAFDPVITHTFRLSDAVTAMDVAADAAISGKVVLELDAG